MDRIDQKRRSWNMSRIKGRDTAPEIQVRSILHRLGYRFRLHRKNLPGRPDVVLRKWNAAIFVHGCFWHQHAGCDLCYMPKSNTEFWKTKLAANVARDRRNETALRNAGWNVIVVWECELRDTDLLARRLATAIER